MVDEVNDIIKYSIEHSIGSQSYQENMVNKWKDSVIENCLTKLSKLGKPFKYIGKVETLLLFMFIRCFYFFYLDVLVLTAIIYLTPI